MQRVLSWDYVRPFLLVLFAPAENPRRVFGSGWGGNIRLLLWVWPVRLACGWPMPVALPRPRGRALNPTPSAAHMGRTCPGAVPPAPLAEQTTAHGQPSAAHSYRGAGRGGELQEASTRLPARWGGGN